MIKSRYAALDRAQLAALVPELLLLGQLIDRAGMPWILSIFDRQTMQKIAIEEWMAASPIYTRRMQRALNYVGDDVVTIFKGLQLDIGAPPQFMDFRFSVTDAQHGEFWLDHCGALMDVEPMGEDYVRGMCHDIEDPTFDATAVATNPLAQVRPVHRPPRVPADQMPHCRWTVIIDDTHPPVSESPGCLELMETEMAKVELDPIDPSDEGLSDYSGPLVSDLDFAAFSKSTLVRIADEVALQVQLLQVACQRAVLRHADEAQTEKILGKQLIGITGVAGDRISKATGITNPIDLISLLPMLNPAALITISEELAIDFTAVEGWGTLSVDWWARALSAAVQAIDSRLAVEASNDRFRLIQLAEPAQESPEVSVTKVSTGSNFEFEQRLALPIISVS